MPATPDTLTGLLIQETQAAIYSAMLALATTLGLPVTSWQPGDPTRSLFFLESSLIEALEEEVTGFVQSGFLDYATGTWLQVLAQEVFNVIVPPATFATTTTQVLTNAGGGIYEFAADGGDTHFSCSASGATYTNTTGGTLTGVGSVQVSPTVGPTITMTVVADQAGSASTAGPGEIDTLVTGLLGVTTSNTTAAVGIDQQSDATTVQQCRNKLGALSPNGPAAAYAYVALNPALTGIQTPTRVRVYDSSDTGDVIVYVAGPSGAALSGGDVAAVLTAIETWATPLCITPSVSSAAPVTLAVTYTVWVYQSVNQTSAQIQAAISTALTDYFALQPIGGNIIPPSNTGDLYVSEVESVIGSVFPQIFKVSVSLPVADVVLANNEVAVLGTVTGTVNIISGG